MSMEYLVLSTARERFFELFHFWSSERRLCWKGWTLDRQREVTS
jgi:hypothetical protein